MTVKCIVCVELIKSCPKLVQNVKYEWNLQIEVLKPTFNH
jgi:hypothetical protein